MAELNEERARRVRIDATGSALITSSTALSALAFAATTLVTKAGSLQLPNLSLGTLAVTFAAFMIAAVCGLCGGGRIHKNETVAISTMEEWRTTRWRSARSDEAQAHLQFLIKYMVQLRSFNERRARWVIGGSFAQIVAITSLSVAVLGILMDAMYPEWSLGGWLDTPSTSADEK